MATIADGKTQMNVRCCTCTPLNKSDRQCIELIFTTRTSDQIAYSQPVSSITSLITMCNTSSFTEWAIITGTQYTL